MTYRNSYTGFSKNPLLKYWTSNIQDWKLKWQHFFCRGWFDLDKISQTGAEWHVDCNDMAEIETRSRIPIRRTFGWIQWHVIPVPPATLQGATTGPGRIQYHNPSATYHTAGCCHRANSLSWFQSYMPHCRVLLPGEFDDMSSQSHVSRCRVGLLPFGEFTVMFPEPHCRVQSLGEINVIIVPHCRV